MKMRRLHVLDETADKNIGSDGVRLMFYHGHGHQTARPESRTSSTTQAFSEHVRSKLIGNH